MRGDQDGDALVAVDLPQMLPQVDAGGGVEAGAWLVEQQNARPVQQSLGDFDAPPHAATETFDALRRAIAQADGFEGAVDPPAQVRAAQSVEMALMQQVFTGGELLIETGRLKHDAKPRANEIPLDGGIDAENPHVPGGGWNERREDAEQRCLA